MQAIQQALALYSAREWGKAEQLCRMILATQATHFDALNLLGIITAQTQRPQEAVGFFGKAATVKKNEPTVHNNYGNVLRDLGRLEEALRSYNRAVQINPNYAEAHYNRGLTLHGLRRFDDALRSYDRAIKLKPDYAIACNNRGVVLRELQRLDEAVQSYDRAISLQPDYVTAYNNRGVALHELKRSAAALESYDRALALNPNYAEALHNQGGVLRTLKRFDEALSSFERALQINPRYADAHNGRGTTLQHLNRQAEALVSFDQAIALDPANAQALYNRGNTLRVLHLYEHALDSYQRALAIKPDFADDYFNRGTVLHELKRYDEALDSFRLALKSNPEQRWLHGICLHAQMRVCDWTGLDALMAELASRIEQGYPASPPFAIATLSDSPPLQRRSAEIWVRESYPARSELPPLAKSQRRDRIRVGYFSADYYNHATALLAAGLFELHDRSRFEIVGFDFGPGTRDDMTERVAAAFDQYFDVRSKTDAQIAAFSRAAGIDIAVDLKGFTMHERAGIFSHRAAPIQVNYLGYPGTMGAAFIDYLVADETVIPLAARPHYAEKIVYLPGSYQVNDRSRPIAQHSGSRTDFGLPPTGFVFCSFNNVYKITPPVFDCWMRILRRVEHSVLWLLDDNASATSNLRKAAGRAGVDPARLIFSERLLPQDHLARHRLADLFIDTFPCNAHTTASDALWAGLPVLTCAGESFPSRVAASLLNAAELPELITTTLTDYEELAVELAIKPQRLAAITAKLCQNRLITPLFNTELFTRRLEDAYSQMYERYQADAAPECLFVSA